MSELSHTLEKNTNLMLAAPELGYTKAVLFIIRINPPRSSGCCCLDMRNYHTNMYIIVEKKIEITI